MLNRQTLCWWTLTNSALLSPNKNSPSFMTSQMVQVFLLVNIIQVQNSNVITKLDFAIVISKNAVLSPTAYFIVMYQTPNTYTCTVQTLLLDLLTYPEGPRLRDTISHGEVDLESCPCAVANHLLGVCYSFCVRTLPTNSGLRQVSSMKYIVHCSKNQNNSKV